MTMWNHAIMQPSPLGSGMSPPCTAQPAPPPGASNGWRPLHPVREIGYVHEFRCSPDSCLDLCCHRYTHVAVDRSTVTRCASDAPDLLRHFARDGDGHRMTLHDGRCSALRGRQCDIHARRGPLFQPEICHFYPRRALRLGSGIYVTSVLSCDIVLRRVLAAGADFSWHDADWERVPQHLPDLLADRFPGATAETALVMHGLTRDLVDARGSKEALAALLVLAGLLDGSPREQWPSRIGGHLALLHRDMLLELCRTTADTAGGRWSLEAFLSMMGSLARAPHHRELGRLALEARSLVLERGVPWTTRAMADPAWQASVEPLLERYLKARLCEGLFPLDPWGTCLDDAWLLAASYCLLRLGLLARHHPAGASVDAEAFTRAASAVEFWLHGRRQEIHDHAHARGWIDLHRTVALVLGH